MKIGILGFGSMGKTHAYSIANLKYFYNPLPFKAEVAGITTRNPARTAELVETYGVGKVYLSEDDMINDPEIDVIDICTPNTAHYETLKKAIAAGKNIYCENVPDKAFEKALSLIDKDSALIVTGSFYLVSHIRNMKKE